MTAEPTPAPIARRNPPAPLKTGNANHLPWVPASGPAHILESKAIFYLTKRVNHKQYQTYDQSHVILAKIVCNLRRYYLQSQESTVRLIQKYYNPKADYEWSEAAIRLVWEEVAGITPALGAADARSKAKQQKLSLENEVVDLIAWTVPGGRVLDTDLLKVFKEWNPGIKVTPHAFTKAVNAVTGQTKTPSNGKRYWDGFHLPTPGELEARKTQAA